MLLDGHATVGDVEQKATHIPPEALRNLLRSLLSGGLVRAATIEESGGLDFSAFFDAARSAEPSDGANASAHLEAASGEPHRRAYRSRKHSSPLAERTMCSRRKHGRVYTS